MEGTLNPEAPLRKIFRGRFVMGNFFFNVPLIQRGYESKCSRYENLLEKFVQLNSIPENHDIFEKNWNCITVTAGVTLEQIVR